MGKNSFQSVYRKKQENEEGPHSAGQLTEEDYKNAQQFSLEELKEVWESIMMAMTGGTGSLFAAMKSGKLELDEKNHFITFYVSNKLENGEVNANKRQILGALRTRLKNKVVDLTVKIAKEKSTIEYRPYTNKDKFEYLAKKNPALKLLKEKLDLDYDI